MRRALLLHGFTLIELLVVITLSMYRIDGTPVRSPIDRNILADDGSVRRYTHLAWNEHEIEGGQMVSIPEQSVTGTGSWGYISHLPRPD